MSGSKDALGSQAQVVVTDLALFELQAFSSFHRVKQKCLLGRGIFASR